MCIALSRFTAEYQLNSSQPDSELANGALSVTIFNWVLLLYCYRLAHMSAIHLPQLRAGEGE